MTDDARFRYPVVYDHTYMDKPGVKPLGPISVTLGADESLKIVKEFLGREWRKLIREPLGALRYPFVVPGATYNNLWDWDSFFTACALPDEALEYGKGSVLNLLAGVREDGRPPKMASNDGRYLYYHPIPLHAQFAYLMAVRLNDFAWVDPFWTTFEAITGWYEREARARKDYFVWTDYCGNGIDNNPAVYGRPARSSAGVDLACWHYREYRALARLASALGKEGCETYRQKADDLAALIRARYWDHMDRFFYNVDCMMDSAQTGLQGVTWEAFLKFPNCASIFPLWAKVATPEQAAFVRERILSPKEFLSVAGVRSHSAVDPIYNNNPSGNPSNWQGPVWGLSTFLAAYALAKYTWQTDALAIAHRTVRTFAADILQNGCLHEFYHGDTGQPLIKPGFLSWNVLALKAVDDLRGGRDCTTLDLLA